MYAMNKLVNDKEVVVGWYASSCDGEAITTYSCLIHEFYGRYVPWVGASE
jgi:hypothetical protein